MSSASATQTTYRFERWRALSSGILETAGTTFLLLIAVQHFRAGAISKAILAGSGSVGLFISPLVVAYVTSIRWNTSRAAAWVLLTGAIGFFLAAFLPFLPIYVFGCLLGMAASAAGIPLVTQMYQENYPADRRGHFFSRSVMIRIAMAALFSELGGRYLSANLGGFQKLLFLFGCAMAFGSWCLSRCPTQPLTHAGGTHPLRALRFVKEDPLFRHTLICWMLMGFGNLMMLPMRVEYLANPKYQMNFDPSMVALLTGVIPNVARLIMSPVWGGLFDRMNFFTLRVLLNVGFAIGIISFFLSDQLWGLVLAAVIFGISNAGGDIAWSLWVTKFAPPQRVADYMSVHTFFTGLRGVAAPIVAFQLAKVVPFWVLALISGGLIISASFLLVPEISKTRSSKKATALVEEISE